MKTFRGMRVATLIVALVSLTVNLVPASAAPPAPPPANRRIIGAPPSPQRIVEVPVPHRDRRALDVQIELLGGDGRLVYPGQPVGFSFRVNRDAYVVIYDIDTEGHTHLLYPRSAWDPEYVRGGVLHHLPGRDANYRLVADGPPGEEFVVVVASDEPIADRWVECWDGLAGRHEYDQLGGTSARTGFVRGDRFVAMDRVASRLIEVPVERWERGTARGYTSFFVGDPTCRPGRSGRQGRGQGHEKRRHLRGQ
ncbi:MAG: DUF4384 domain-containing protein [Candidatus Eisenbacteria bacterium]|nr:DUF4384 domain-containing protein [Candidatus Eisenbacteria bacterium]